MKYIFVVLVSCFFLVSCFSLERRQIIFRENAEYWIGYDSSVLKGTKPYYIENRGKDFQIYHYNHNGCESAYVIALTGNKIVEWDVEEGNKKCSVGIGFGSP